MQLDPDLTPRDELVLEYLDRLPHPPYPVQEEALLAWAACDGGVLLSAPTGTGKTLVAEAAVYEALRTGTEVYYSTPLIALTDQKLDELRATVARWGYGPETVGLITGNRSVNPDAPVKVVVAEVLLNRLLQRSSFDFSSVSAVVMDEFHHFGDADRGIVWELALALLPPNVRVMLLSATVGAASEFVAWVARSTGRRLTLVEGTERRVPLVFEWVGEELLPDFAERVAGGTDDRRRTPALVFCFDRQACWDAAEVLKGRDLFAEGQRSALLKRLDDFDFRIGAGNKLRTLLARGVGVHHAGLLPRYRRAVEALFQEKLLSVCVCTETLAAGINLPARSVALTTLVKGPRDRKRVIDAGSAQQMFGRAGRPQFDAEGHVYAIAHPDDVKLAKWKEKYDSIPEDTKDPGLMKAKKKLLKKKPTRRSNVTYWTAEQFEKLRAAPPAKLASRGRLTWRWLGHLLAADPAVGPIREVVRRRLMEPAGIEEELKRLTRMLVTLHRLGVVVLDPPPPPVWLDATKPNASTEPAGKPDDVPPTPSPVPDPAARLTLGDASLTRARPAPKVAAKTGLPMPDAPADALPPGPPAYDPVTAMPTPRLADLMTFRAVHPLFGLFLIEHLGKADEAEALQLLEGVLEMPPAVARSMRPPKPDELPPGPLATEVLDPAILTRGLMSAEELYPPADQSDVEFELRRYPPALADKARLVFESEVDHAGGLRVTPVWAAGDLLARGGDFDAFVRARDLQRQEGIVFRHLLRLALLCGEFARLTPPGLDPAEWQGRMRATADALTASCRAVDPRSTDEALDAADDSPADG